MTDPVTEPVEKQINTRLYVFGPWTDPKDLADEATELGKRAMDWMMGKDVLMDADLSRILRREFAAQDRYREAMTRSCANLSGKLRQRAAQVVDGTDLPLSPAEAYARGFKQGAYQALSHAAQDAQDVINAGVVAMREEPA